MQRPNAGSRGLTSDTSCPAFAWSHDQPSAAGAGTLHSQQLHVAPSPARPECLADLNAWSRPAVSAVLAVSFVYGHAQVQSLPTKEFSSSLYCTVRFAYNTAS